MSQGNDGRDAAGAVVACGPGDWVEIERVLLEPADRAPGLPANTAATPLGRWVMGFALAEARIGDEVEIETMTGRVELGRLVEISPGYTHTFGEPPRELAAVGRDLRARLADWRTGRAAGGA
ncbi:MAG: 2-amino-4-oxopentanoate thiolase subunit OrtA [Coriobacteriia bacterium]